MDDLSSGMAPPPTLSIGASDTAMTVDTAKCITRACICTDVVDSAGDIVEPGGCDTSIHRLNPVVLFHHGIGIGGPDSPGHILPIGVALDVAGNYAVEVTPQTVMATTKFAQSSPFAMQVFALFAEGVLRGWSVNALPIADTWQRIADKPMPGGQLKRCWRYNQWQLKEYSATALPVNPEALTIAVEKGMVGGEKMGAILKAFLQPYCLSANRAQGIVLPPLNRKAATPTIAAHKGNGSVVKAETKNMSVLRGKNSSGNRDLLIAGSGLAAGALLAEDESGDDRGKEKKGVEDEKEKPDPEGKEDNEGDDSEKKAEDLKPGERGMIDQHQMIRDHRIENARHWHATDDPEAEATHQAIDDHLAKAEEAAGDYMETKGHKRPEPMDFEEVKGTCKASELSKLIGGKVGESEDANVYYKGTSYRGKGFWGLLKASTAEESKLSPVEARIVSRELERINRRLAGK